MVAEEDEIVLLRSDGEQVMITTDVPGVIRELYVDAGLELLPGALIALIDED